MTQTKRRSFCNSHIALKILSVDETKKNQNSVPQFQIKVIYHLKVT